MNARRAAAIPLLWLPVASAAPLSLPQRGLTPCDVDAQAGTVNGYAQARASNDAVHVTACDPSGRRFYLPRRPLHRRTLTPAPLFAVSLAKQSCNVDFARRLAHALIHCQRRHQHFL